MTKKLFFILTIAFFITSKAYSSDCSSMNKAPIINVTSSYGSLIINNNKTYTEITDMAKKQNLIENNLFANGLSTVNINFDISVQIKATPLENNSFCINPTEINLFLGLDSPTIYIAKELQPNSCKYNQTLRHEQIHHQINKTTLQYYLPLFKQASFKIIKSIQPKKVNDISQVEQTTKHLTKEYHQKLLPLIDYIKKEMLNQQQKLDSPKNYLYQDSLCL